MPEAGGLDDEGKVDRFAGAAGTAPQGSAEL
jgi:hypothetical protein